MQAARARRAGAAAWLTLMASGCVGWHVESASPREVLRNPDVRAIRVNRPDRTKVYIYDPSIQGDSIVGHPTDRAIARLVLPLSQVQTIATKHTSARQQCPAGPRTGGAVCVSAEFEAGGVLEDGWTEGRKDGKWGLLTFRLSVFPSFRPCVLTLPCAASPAPTPSPPRSARSSPPCSRPPRPRRSARAAPSR